MSDNGKQFDNAKFMDFCAELGIKNYYSSPAARKNPTHGKLGPNWEGPYIISRVVRPGNYELQTEEGKVLHHAWNDEHLKRFYQ